MSDYSRALITQAQLLDYVTSRRGIDWLVTMAEHTIITKRRPDAELPPDPVQYSAEQLAKAMFNVFAHGTPFYWAPEFCDVLIETGPTIGTDMTFDRSLLPAPYGFMYFGKHLPLPNHRLDNLNMPLLAVGWCPNHSQNSEMLGISFVPIINTIGQYIPTGSVPIHDGMPLEARAVMKIPPGEELPEHVMRDPDSIRLWEDIDRIQRVLQYFGAALAFMDQRILVTSNQVPNRTARKAAEQKVKHDQLVRVVHFRRATSVTKRQDASVCATEWSCRWSVRGHWRTITTEKNGTRKVRVSGHVKGPEGKPFRSPRIIGMVDR